MTRKTFRSGDALILKATPVVQYISVPRPRNPRTSVILTSRVPRPTSDAPGTSPYPPEATRLSFTVTAPTYPQTDDVRFADFQLFGWYAVPWTSAWNAPPPPPRSTDPGSSARLGRFGQPTRCPRSPFPRVRLRKFGRALGI